MIQITLFDTGYLIFFSLTSSVFRKWLVVAVGHAHQVQLQKKTERAEIRRKRVQLLNVKTPAAMTAVEGSYECSGVRFLFPYCPVGTVFKCCSVFLPVPSCFLLILFYVACPCVSHRASCWCNMAVFYFLLFLTL